MNDAVRRYTIIVCLALLLSGTVMCTFVACVLGHSLYPVTIVFACFIAMVITPFCCYDQQDSDAGDVGWFITGTFAATSIGLTVIFWRAGELNDIGAILSLCGAVSMVVTVATFLWFIKGSCGLSSSSSIYD